MLERRSEGAPPEAVHQHEHDGTFRPPTLERVERVGQWRRERSERGGPLVARSAEQRGGEIGERSSPEYRADEGSDPVLGETVFGAVPCGGELAQSPTPISALSNRMTRTNAVIST